MILFREVFVSGLREYLGDTAGTLKVTKLAKWKTTAQMVAIAILFAKGVFEHYFGVLAFGMGDDMVTAVLSGQEDDLVGLTWRYQGAIASWWLGVGLLWVAAALTLITGLDYFRKSVPYLKEPE